MEVAFHVNLEADFPLIGEGNSNPLQYSCLENSMDRGAWWATVHGVAKSRTQLRDYHFPLILALNAMAKTLTTIWYRCI